MSRCAACPGINLCIAPDGPEDADILFIGEAPGFNENKRNQVFIGKTGDEVNRHYLPLAGLSRDSVRFTNAIRCYPPGAGGKLDSGRSKDIELLESCATHHLHPDIEGGDYRLLVPMGSFACRAVFGRAFDLELRHGIPTKTSWGIDAFPMWHPALGIHEPKKMLHIRNDWDRLRRYLRGTLKRVKDAHPHPDYREVTDVSELRRLELDQPLGCDTESDRAGRPFCFTYSQAPGTGRLVRADNPSLVRALQQRLGRWEAPLLFHNYLYDWSVCEQLGLRLPYRRIVDTMSRVFHLGNLPQGLKALAFRELGMVMEDFEDVVLPHSRERILDYYRRAQAIEWVKPDPELVRDSKTGDWKIYKPQSMSTKLKRFFTDLRKNPENKDVVQTWEKNWLKQQGMIEDAMGEEWPGVCITHVPFEKALFYACRDSDATRRLLPLIQRMSSNVRKRPQELWRD